MSSSNTTSTASSDSSSPWNNVYSPGVRLERVMFYVTLAVNLTTVPLILYAIWNRDYLPIRSKHVWIMSGVGVGSIIFNVSANIIYGMAGFDNDVTGSCRFWAGFGVMTFGMGVFHSCINMRLIIYYRVFISGKTRTYKKFTLARFLRRFWPLIVMWLPTAVSSITIYVLPPSLSGTRVYTNGARNCVYKHEYMYYVIVYYGVQLVISWYLYIRIRKIGKAFNEFNLAIWSLITFTLLLIYHVTDNFVGFSLKPWGRILNSWLTILMQNSYVWLILGKPVYGHIFDRDRCLQSFHEDMHADSISAQKASISNALIQLYGDDDNIDQYVYTLESTPTPPHDSHRQAAYLESTSSLAASAVTTRVFS